MPSTYLVYANSAAINGFLTWTLMKGMIMGHLRIFNANEIGFSKQGEAFPDLMVEIEKRHLTEAEQAELASEKAEGKTE